MILRDEIHEALEKRFGVYIMNYGCNRPAGYPTLVICSWGRFIAMEIRWNGNPLRKTQQEAKEKIQGQGAIYIEVESVEEAIWKLGEIIDAKLYRNTH